MAVSYGPQARRRLESGSAVRAVLKPGWSRAARCGHISSSTHAPANPASPSPLAIDKCSIALWNRFRFEHEVGEAFGDERQRVLVFLGKATPSNPTDQLDGAHAHP